MEAKKRPWIYTLTGWLDVLFAVFTVSFFVIHTDGYTYILLFWLFIVFIFSYGFLKSILYPEFFLSKITHRGKIAYCFICLMGFLVAIRALRLMMELWNGSLDSHLLRPFSDFLFGLLFFFGCGFSVYKEEKSPVFNWINTIWGNPLRKRLGIKTI